MNKRVASKYLHILLSDFCKAIEFELIVKKLWAEITPLARNEWICSVISAKKDETMKRRITAGLDKIRKGIRRPCCWAGCPHQ